MEVTYNNEDLDLSPENFKLQAVQHVIVRYEDNYYPEMVLKHDLEGAKIKTMISAGIEAWKWPIKKDVLYYFNEDIMCIINEPQPKNNRVEFGAIYIPPDPDELTDKENFDDNLATNQDNQTNDIAGTFELQLKEAATELEEWDSSNDESLAKKKQVTLVDNNVDKDPQ
ncbi:unnamed protein product [Psylliodes chrysocephalus]|uniref:Uncharacterized protein n=1 Tax=Psylliodes chrysocephalus TaxID=3402493 RepID=A0A9P0G8U9_9CUCU|nr:unnamed protein product [Psylliodes chrysocephala]